MGHPHLDICPILVSLRGRERESTVEGEVARALREEARPVRVLAPVSQQEIKEAAGLIVLPRAKLFRLLGSFQPPGGGVWAEGEGTAVFAQAMPDGGLRVLRIVPDEKSEAAVEPLVLTRKPSWRAPAVPDAEWPRGPGEDAEFERRRELIQQWLDENAEFTLVGNGQELPGIPVEAPAGGAYKFLDLVVIMSGCDGRELPVLRP